MGVQDRLAALYLRAINALDDPSGQGLVEYALIIAFIAVVLVGALVSVRGGLNNAFNSIQYVLATSGG